MGMSVSSAGGVKAEPNVVPMIDVMLVLLIIFMVVTPAITSGFTAVAPSGINLKSHPEVDTDQVLGIDAYGRYYLNKKQIDSVDLAPALKAIFELRTIDQILYVKADKGLEYGKILDAIDIASKSGVRMVGAITDQQPGTASTVVGDELSGSKKTP